MAASLSQIRLGRGKQSGDMEFQTFGPEILDPPNSGLVPELRVLGSTKSSLWISGVSREHFPHLF